MTEYTPRVGDRVRVAYEGIVSVADPFSFRVNSTGPGDGWIVSVAVVSDPNLSVEKSPDPEPEWWPPRGGDVVAYYDSAYLRHDSYDTTSWQNTSGARLNDEQILAAHHEGVARLIVRSGKTVAE